MNSILINFERENNDINAAYDKVKSLFPDVKIIKNPHKSELEKMRRNEEYLDMLEQSRKEIAEGKYITISKEQLELWADE